ncbi:MAG: oxidoreductase, partial [Cyclobacteriaceae bacterium]|nr:oxidoreductase [Cyclobacteriaceae bacterium]
FQPSMLLGPRTESRAGESIGKMVMKALDFAVPKKYKAIESEKVARAMLVLAKKNANGKFVHMSGELQDY